MPLEQDMEPRVWGDTERLTWMDANHGYWDGRLLYWGGTPRTPGRRTTRGVSLRDAVDKASGASALGLPERIEPSAARLLHAGREMVRMVGRFEERPLGVFWNEVRVPSSHLVLALGVVERWRPLGFWVTLRSLPELPHRKT